MRHIRPPPPDLARCPHRERGGLAFPCPRSKRAMAGQESRSLGRDEGAVPCPVRWGRERPRRGERSRPCSRQWALPEKRRLFAICRAAPPEKEEKRERPRGQAAASRGRLWFFFALPPKRGQRGRRDETHPAAPRLAWPAVPTGRGAAWLSLVPRSKRAMADQGSRSLGRDEGAVTRPVRGGGERSLPTVPHPVSPSAFHRGSAPALWHHSFKKEGWRAPLSCVRQPGSSLSGEGWGARSPKTIVLFTWGESTSPGRRTRCPG